MLISIVATGAIWYASTFELRDKMINAGMNTEISTKLINECKIQAKKNISVERCIKAGFAISMNETQGFKTAYKNSGFGVQKAYNSADESIKDWVKKYYKFWYKWKDGTHFYGSKYKKAPTAYCTEEKSSGSIGYCKNGREHFDYFINKLK